MAKLKPAWLCSFGLRKCSLKNYDPHGIRLIRSIRGSTENVTHNTQFSPVSAQKSPSPSFFRTKMSVITNICFIFGLRNKTTAHKGRSISYI
jgi:hypothetical protein